MTEKRFSQKDEDDWEILDRGNHFAYAHSGYQAEKIIQELNRLNDENEQLKQQLKKNTDFLIRSAERLGFKSLDHLLYTLDKGEIYGYSTANWGD